MMMLRRLALLVMALGTSISVLTFLLLTTILSVQASDAAVSRLLQDHNSPQQLAPHVLPASEACGSGEQLPPWTICLYGEVSQVDTLGQIHVLANVPVTISRGSHIVTGTTLLRPGDAAPSYEIDISPLNPTFLEPVTLTASVSDTLVHRQVVVFPNFDTYSQRYDVQVSRVGSLDEAPLWGYVVDFKAGGPVAGAEVVAGHAGQSVTVTTSAQNSAFLPIYTLTADNLATIGALSGDEITVTARYHQDTDQQVIHLQDESQQVNFVTGWRCTDFNPLPQVGGHGGLPQVGGHGGLPDVACLWGYGLVSGTPRSGMDVTVEISGTVFQGHTRLYPEETLPRYGIGMPNASLLVGQPLTITGVYSGYATITHAGLALDSEQSQRVDVHAAEITALNFATGSVGDVVWNAGYLWAGTSGGLVQWDPFAQTYIPVPIPNGHVFNSVGEIEVASDGTMWLATNNGASHYDPSNPNTNEWLDHVSTEDGLRSDSVQALAIGQGEAVWLGTSEGACRYLPSSGQCDPIDPPGFTRYVTELAVGHDGSVWFGSGGEAADVVRYFPDSYPHWVTYTAASGVLPSPYVRSITVASDGSVWIGTSAGAAHYSPGASPEWTSYSIVDGMADRGVASIVEDSDGSLWFGHPIGYSGGGVTHYSPGSQPEWQVFRVNDGLIHSQVNDIALDGSGTVWFSTPAGISQYVAGSSPSWTALRTNSLSDNRVRALALDNQDGLWAGTATGLDRYDFAGGEWQNFVVSGGVKAIALAEDDSVWFGGSKVTRYTPGGNPAWQVFEPEDGLVSYGVWDITAHPDGSIWIGANGGVSRYILGDPPVWETYTTTHGLVPGQIRSVGVGADGSLWFGSFQHGVSHYIPTTGDWETITVSSMSNADVYDIARAPDGSMWFATNRDFFHYIPDTNEWEHIRPSGINLGGAPFILYVEDDNTIWCGTPAGVCRYVRDANQPWELFTEEDGLPNNWGNAIVPDGAGSFWIGTDGGLVHWTAPVRQSDLAVRVLGPTSVHAGELRTYTLSVENHGQVAGRNTQLALTLPVGLNLVSATPPPASSSPIAWNFGALAFNNTVTVTLMAAVDGSLNSSVALTTTAVATTDSPETYLTNNTAYVVSRVRSPDRSDVRVSLAGPPLLIPGSNASYTLWVDNVDEMDADDVMLTVALPSEIIYQDATPPPTAGLTWELGTLSGLAAPQQITLTVHVTEAVSPGTSKTVLANVSTSSPESNSSNNSASSTIATSLTDALTLILVAPDRLAARYGASPLMTKLYDLAQHTAVQGVVVDVGRDPTVRQRYQEWDANPSSWQAANQVAAAIKSLIDQYTIAYPNLHYLTTVGGDDVIPFYRVIDQNPTQWHERTYRSFVPTGSVRAALAADRLLTDDFYADRDPSIPESPFWSDNHLMYLPDFALGRLVETPQEIIAALDAFLLSGGTIDLEPGIIGGDLQLANDLQRAQCSILQQDGLVADLCTTNGNLLRNHFLSQSAGSSWMALHSNHFSSGPLLATSIVQSFQDYVGDLMVNIGCHAGLNVGPDQSALPNIDLVQAMLGKGGVVIGPTAYSYASPFGIELSERLAVNLTDALLEGASQEIGAALARAKQEYYTAHEGWFDYLDEKVLLPVTLYGLPMSRVNTPDAGIRNASTLPFDALITKESNTSSVITYTHTLSGFTYNRRDIETGTYYDLDGEVIAQDGLPVQPAYSLAISSTISGRTPRGIVLRDAHYTAQYSFDPVIAQSWAAGTAASTDRQEPPALFNGWDRPVPYALGQFSGLVDNSASINLALGRYNKDTSAQQLFDNLVLQVLYSADADAIAPEIVEAHAEASDAYAVVFIAATDNNEVDQVVAVCDDGAGRWQTANLQASGGNWQGTCSGHVTEIYVQAIDRAGNITISDWFVPDQLPPLAVTLADFQAVCDGSAATITWETLSEVGNQGFNLWRGLSAQEPSVRLNTTLIPSQNPGGTQGAVYSWLDDTIESGTQYWYWLEGIDLGNHVTRFGPVEVLCQVPTAVLLSTLDVSHATSRVFPLIWPLAALVFGMIVLFAVKRTRYKRPGLTLGERTNPELKAPCNQSS